ncbi:hypothetical protein OR1_03815 [Geobacter sp. OR-1]|uniref:hypothetical protein n=1 Tax=Geobacter sp. OR-1 TaxID=1266765 RepID=UPI000543181E|nr:hypothetical protein [Geobacter sp. OR-1]GAM11499.1 hypothetical protein OR1_03815 [Geobacter sp. OR-1]
MTVFHLLDTGEARPAAVNHLVYGRCAASVMNDGQVVCDDHLFALDTDNPPAPGEQVMIWRDHDYFCCKVSEYEQIYRH